jgi:hypothetical protein
MNYFGDNPLAAGGLGGLAEPRRPAPVERRRYRVPRARVPEEMKASADEPRMVVTVLDQDGRTVRRYRVQPDARVQTPVPPGGSATGSLLSADGEVLDRKHGQRGTHTLSGFDDRPRPRHRYTVTRRASAPTPELTGPGRSFLPSRLPLSRVPALAPRKVRLT